MAPPHRDPVRADLSAGAEKLCLLAGLTAGLAYSTFASFVANALTPVTGRIVEADTFRRAVSGHYQEVFSLSGTLSHFDRIGDCLCPGLVVDAGDARVLAARRLGTHRCNRSQPVGRTVADASDSPAAK